MQDRRTIGNRSNMCPYSPGWTFGSPNSGNLCRYASAITPIPPICASPMENSDTKIRYFGELSGNLKYRDIFGRYVTCGASSLIRQVTFS
ncbi:hypothetical protein, partial [Paenibacillus macerans]|uniref:hypothetical protein n=1 Tax=Paenibacillus macerans TaxID=44252 RepID=UPI001C3FDCD4